MLSEATPESQVVPWDLDQVSTQKDSKENWRREVSNQKTEDKQGGEGLFSSEVDERSEVDAAHEREHTHTHAHKYAYTHMHTCIQCMATQYTNA